MPIRRKVTGLKRGSKGFVFKIPIAEAGNISQDEINKHLREVYGTDELEVFMGGKVKPIKQYLGEFEKLRKLHKSNLGAMGSRPRVDLFNDVKGNGYLLGRNFLRMKYTGNNPNKKEELSGRENLVVDVDSKYLTFKPAVVLHGVTGRDWEKRSAGHRDSFEDLMSILQRGLVRGETIYSDNVTRKIEKGHVASVYDFWKGHICGWAQPSSKPGITYGDIYNLEIIPPKERKLNEKGKENGIIVDYADPSTIIGVNIFLDPSIIGPSDEFEENVWEHKQNIEDKMAFYKKEISEKYGIPVRFYSPDRPSFSQDFLYTGDPLKNPKRIFPQKQSLEQRASSATAVIAFIGSLFFTTSNLTGNVIGTLSTNTTNLIGIILFLIGIVGAVVYIKKSKH